MERRSGRLTARQPPLASIPDSYTTPGLLRYGKNTEIVITGGDCVTGHDPATGTELWRANGLNPNNDPSYRIVASPVIFNDIIYAPTRVRPLLALRAGGRGDITSSHLLWSTVEARCANASH